MTRHTVRVTFVRDDRDESIEAGTATFEGKPYDDFDEAQARKELIDDGRLAIGPDVVTFAGTIVPTAKLDRIRVEIASKSVGS